MSSSSEHWQAVLDLLPPDLRVYQGSVPARPSYPYVLAWMGVSSRDAAALSDEPAERTYRYRITVAGLSELSVMIVQDRVRDVLDRATVTVAGWSPARLRLQPLAPVLEDLNVTLSEGSHPFYSVDEYLARTSSD